MIAATPIIFRPNQIWLDYQFFDFLWNVYTEIFYVYSILIYKNKALQLYHI